MRLTDWLGALVFWVFIIGASYVVETIAPTIYTNCAESTDHTGCADQF